MTDKQYSILDEILAEQYTRGYEEGRCTGYKNRKIEEEFEDNYGCGLNDAWVCAKKLRHMDYSTLYEVFKGDDVVIHNIQVMGLEAVFEKYSASEAIAKIKEYEEKQKQTDEEIKVGDEVIHDGEQVGIITQVDEYGYTIMDNSGKSGYYITDDIRKTNRNFTQIDEILKQMKEVEE